MERLVVIHDPTWLGSIRAGTSETLSVGCQSDARLAHRRFRPDVLSPVHIGDWVLIDEQEGIVTDITDVNTRLENFDGEFVIIPNDRVSDRAVTDRSRKGLLRLTVDIGVDYDTDVDRAMDLAREAMPDSRTPSIHRRRMSPKDFGDSAVVMDSGWIDRPSARRWWRARTATISAVSEAFDEEGIAIPFPQRALSNRVDPSADVAGRRRGDAPDGDGRPQVEAVEKDPRPRSSIPVRSRAC